MLTGQCSFQFNRWNISKEIFTIILLLETAGSGVACDVITGTGVLAVALFACDAEPLSFRVSTGTREDRDLFRCSSVRMSL